MNFLSEKNFWDTISDVSTDSNRRQCVVAYVSDYSSINFQSGDLLITDASDESIRSGKTSAKELRKLHKIGVQIYTKPLLHAKLYVFDSCIVIGSCNLSGSSKNRLIESAVLLRHKKIIAEAIEYIDKLKFLSERVTDDFIERILNIPVHYSYGKTEKKLETKRDELWRLRVPPNALSKEMKCYFHALIVAQLGDLLPNQDFSLWRGKTGKDAFRAHLSATPRRMNGANGTYSLTAEGVEYFSARKLDQNMVEQFLLAIKTGDSTKLPESVENKELVQLE